MSPAHHQVENITALISDLTLLGIGRASAIALSAAGWNVVLTARRTDALIETSKQCASPTLVVAGNITEEDFVAELFAKTIQEFGESGGGLISTLLTQSLRPPRSSVQRTRSCAPLLSPLLNVIIYRMLEEVPRRFQSKICLSRHSRA